MSVHAQNPHPLTMLFSIHEIRKGLPGWMWVDTIVAFEPGRYMHAIKNLSQAEDYFHDHFDGSDGLPATAVMPASLIVEGMAQTAGLLVGSVNQFKEKVILC